MLLRVSSAMMMTAGGGGLLPAKQQQPAQQTAALAMPQHYLILVRLPAPVLIQQQRYPHIRQGIRAGHSVLRNSLAMS